MQFRSFEEGRAEAFLARGSLGQKKGLIVRVELELFSQTTISKFQTQEWCKEEILNSLEQQPS